MLIIKSISTIIMLLIITSIITNFAAAAQQSKSVGIKITSPIKGQLIPLPDNDLKISGIAAHNGSVTCNVYIIVNDIKPYQKALPTGGHNDIKDYSTWIYNLVPSYTTIKAGTNKITSKLACQGNNTKTGHTSLTQYYGINVTGTAHSVKNLSNSNMSNSNFINNKKQTSTEKENVSISNERIKRLGSVYTNSQPVTLLSTAGILSLSTPRVDKHSELTTRLATKTDDINLNNNASTEYAKEQSNTSAVDKTQKTSFSSNHSNNNTKSLSISIHLAKGPIHVGNRENLTVAVTDSNSTHAIPGAAILGKIVNPSGVFKKLEGTTDGKGKVLYSWQISGDNTSGKYRVLMDASAPGYENNSVSKAFTVLPIRTIIYNKDNSMTSDLRNNPSNANSRPILSLSPKTYNNLNSRLIFSNQNPPPLALQSRVYIPSANSLGYENSRVYIPSSNHNNNNMISTYNKVSIPNPNTNSTVEQGVNSIQKPIEQGVNPIQKPQLSNNQEPFVMATPLSHINNGTYGTSLLASHQISSTATAIAVDLVDRMRVMGFDSGLIGSP
ncbi:MAG TPA: hypothetical protein VEH06_11360 [Candidatus Bathyarchaeia archaeon]|nr:hypothetical protein [Candidatus Bathyarchaeia archaeon]